jgi:amino acid transporter
VVVCCIVNTRGKNISITTGQRKHLRALYESLWFPFHGKPGSTGGCPLNGRYVMTNKMKVMFTIVSTFSALLIVILTSPYAIEAIGNMLSEVENMLGLNDIPRLFILVVLIISSLYLALGQRRHF